MHRATPFLAALLFVAVGCGASDETPGPTLKQAAEAPIPGWPEPSEAQKTAAARLSVPFRFEEPATGLRFVLVPGGTFAMGSPDGEPGRDDDEGPVHTVALSPFYLSMFETTNAQYRKFKPEHHSDAGFDEDTQPVVEVSQADAREFVAWLSSRDPGSGGTRRAVYALPSEAQWEHACRAATTTPFAFGDSLEAAEANFGGEVGRTVEVGRYPANAWGLYDMHGNVWEWCQDRYARHFYARDEAKRKDPRNTDPEAVDRTARGGGWGFPDDGVRSAFRRRLSSSRRGSALGFRVAKTVAPE